MPAYFNEGFFVRKPAWHKLGIVLDDYPGRDEAIRLAGHDFNVTAAPLFARLGTPEAPVFKAIDGWRQLIAESSGERKNPFHGNLIHVARDSYAVIQNTVMYDFAEALLDQGFRYETGITLKDGALTALTLLLDEPIQIAGDDSLVLPYLSLSNAHDGSGALKGRSTQVRVVCANTESMAEAEGKRLGTDFTIRHTQKWAGRVEDAKKAIKGARSNIESYRVAMEELGGIRVTASDRELFAHALVLDQKIASVPRFKADVAKGAYTAQVQKNVEDAKKAVLGLFNGPTIPDEHKLTGYGLHLAGVEYLDHIRKANNDASRVGRSLLRDEPAKARITPLLRSIVAAAA